MKRGKSYSRRGFLKKATGLAAGAIGFPYIVWPSALGKAGNVAASERITMGSIAVGGRGGGLLRNFLSLKDAQVVAGCGIHTIDIATWGNGTDLTGPVQVEGIGEFPTDGLCNCATGREVNLYWANGVTMNFTDGKRNPLGIKFEGEDGWVFVKEEHLGGKPAASEKWLLDKPLEPDEVHLPVSNHHQQNFLDCVKSRARTVAPVASAVRSDTLCQLSDIAMRLGRKLRRNPEKERFVKDAQANRMLSRPMRSPWRL